MFLNFLETLHKMLLLLEEVYIYIFFGFDKIFFELRSFNFSTFMKIFFSF